MNTTRATVASAAVVAALAGAAAGAGTYAALGGAETTAVREAAPASSTHARPAAAQTSLSVGEVYRRARKGVVEVTVTSSGSSPFPFDGGGQGRQQAQGSGFVYDEQGHVVTNQHVVDGAEMITVRFWNGAAYKARVVGTDPSTDVAVLDVDAPASLLQPLALGNSSVLAVGDGVVAIGSPFGLEETVTSGIVSALDREIESPNGFAIDSAIQTDAAINHGNSGGPLLDLQGEVIGVNAQIESESGGNDGVGFAIPSNTVGSVAEQLIADGAVEHAYMGVSVATISAAAAEALDVPQGVAVTAVREGTPAADAGLRAATTTRTVDGEEVPTGGDVITKIDGTAVRSAADLRRLVDAKRPGDVIQVTYVRAGASKTASVTLASRPS
jgi:S1-C subfamily serine protease